MKNKVNESTRFLWLIELLDFLVLEQSEMNNYLYINPLTLEGVLFLGFGNGSIRDLLIKCFEHRKNFLDLLDHLDNSGYSIENYSNLNNQIGPITTKVDGGVFVENKLPFTVPGKFSIVSRNFVHKGQTSLILAQDEFVFSILRILELVLLYPEKAKVNINLLLDEKDILTAVARIDNSFLTEILAEVNPESIKTFFPSIPLNKISNKIDFKENKKANEWKLILTRVVILLYVHDPQTIEIVSAKTLLEALIKNGFQSLSLKTFEPELSRIRKLLKVQHKNSN